MGGREGRFVHSKENLLKWSSSGRKSIRGGGGERKKRQKEKRVKNSEGLR